MISGFSYDVFERRHCSGDDNEVRVLTAMVSRLQDSMERQQKQLTQLEETLAKQDDFLKRRLPARDCYELHKDGNNVSGVYKIYVAQATKYVQVYCDMETDGGGWLVFQRRQDGSVDFYREWADYKKGFGDVSSEFWLGNDNLHHLTLQAHYTLRVDMEDFEKNTRYAVYSNFAVASKGDKYKLSLGTYNGTAGDSLTRHAGHSFSTKDRDNDVYRGHCARNHKGAWWYYACDASNLNGLYLGGPHASYADGIEWSSWYGQQYSLKKVEMKLRP
ncbi:Fibrinogen C domain-containing protein 1-B [Lamellibrachia satsuma]|nr:Fibrinogen C domain-containing protein 1-B [Lamellibrachia satsuma]